jgi:hypothetical protein
MTPPLSFVCGRLLKLSLIAGLAAADQGPNGEPGFFQNGAIHAHERNCSITCALVDETKDNVTRKVIHVTHGKIYMYESVHYGRTGVECFFSSSVA